MADLPALAPDARGQRHAVRERIVAGAAGLLAADGRDGLTTRAVAAATGVQAPTIYRLFGDKRGLLDAVAEHGFATYLAAKQVGEPDADPVEALRAGWDLHVGFGIANPALYSLMYGDPQPELRWSAAVAGHRILEEHIHRIAAAGRLRVREPVAVDLVHASGCGTVFAVLAMPEDERDPELLRRSRDAVLATITTDAPAAEGPGPAHAAIALRAVLADATALTGAEQLMLGEWLERLIAGPGA